MGQDIRIEKIERFNRVFNALRRINRLLAKENDKSRLIKGICDILVDGCGYHHARIVLTDPDKHVLQVVDSGHNGTFAPLGGLPSCQTVPRCIDMILEQRDVCLVGDPMQFCRECSLSRSCSNRGAVCTALVHEQHPYGVLMLTTTRHRTMDETERTLIKEGADDVALALYRLDLEQQRLTAEKSRERSQARFQLLIENSLNHISIIQDNRIVFRSHGRRKVHRLIDQAFSPPDFSYVYAGDRKRIQKTYQDLVAGRISHMETDFQYYPVLNGSKNTTTLRWALVSACLIDYLGEPSVLTNIMDVTDSKQVQNFLRIQDKMTSLGRVTAGIAHEIRNPLSGIYIYLKALKQIYNQMGDMPGGVSIVDKIESAAQKIESIIQRVMDFSKPTRPKFIMADLNRHIDEVTKLTSVTLRKSRIKLEKNLCPDLPQCWVEPHLIEQVILNLVTNAAEAMKEYDGKRNIRLSTGVADAGKHMLIRVKDTGPGIPYAHQSKIFDPFYTTKANSSGIGLSICHRIILDHGGTLSFNGAGGPGAEFIIKLPLLTAEAPGIL